MSTETYGGEGNIAAPAMASAPPAEDQNSSYPVLAQPGQQQPQYHVVKTNLKTWLDENKLVNLLQTLNENEIYELEDFEALETDKDVEEFVELLSIQVILRNKLKRSILALKNNNNKNRQVASLGYNEQIHYLININDEKFQTESVDFSNLNFATTLPQPVIQNTATEKKIKTFLNNSGHWLENWGEAILIILTSKWRDSSHQQADIHDISPYQIRVQRGVFIKEKELVVSCVVFNEQPNHISYKEICAITSVVTIWNEQNEIKNWKEMGYDYKPVDPRQLNSTLHNELIDKYGQKLVTSSYLKSSEISNLDHDLRTTLMEIKNIYAKGAMTLPMIKREQSDHIQRAHQLIQNGADANLIIETNGDDLRVLHYAGFICDEKEGSLFITRVIDHGGDPKLGPFTREAINGNSCRVQCHWTPWYFYKNGRNMHLEVPQQYRNEDDIYPHWNFTENGPKHHAIGGPSGGPIYEDMKPDIIMADILRDVIVGNKYVKYGVGVCVLIIVVLIYYLSS